MKPDERVFVYFNMCVFDASPFKSSSQDEREKSPISRAVSFKFKNTKNLHLISVLLLKGIKKFYISFRFSKFLRR